MAGLARFVTDAASYDSAMSAARWIPEFYPQVAIAVSDEAIELRSDHYNSEELAAIWAAALANEHLLERGREHRAAAFEALAR